MAYHTPWWSKFVKEAFWRTKIVLMFMQTLYTFVREFGFSSNMGLGTSSCGRECEIFLAQKEVLSPSCCVEHQNALLWRLSLWWVGVWISDGLLLHRLFSHRNTKPHTELNGDKIMWRNLVRIISENCLSGSFFYRSSEDIFRLWLFFPCFILAREQRS